MSFKVDVISFNWFFILSFSSESSVFNSCTTRSKIRNKNENKIIYSLYIIDYTYHDNFVEQ